MFIKVHLLTNVIAMRCSQVDPIVASFSGGAVGVISALMVVEINNVKQQEHKRCKYCLGTGMPWIASTLSFPLPLSLFASGICLSLFHFL